MASEKHTESTIDDRSGSGRGSNTLVNALIGAVAGIVLSFIPFSTVLGGMLAGYLQGGTDRDGIYVGAVAGLIMFAPFVLILYLFLFVIFLSGAPGVFGGVAVTVFLFAALYVVGLAMLGGFLGAYLNRELSREIPILDDL